VRYPCTVYGLRTRGLPPTRWALAPATCAWCLPTHPTPPWFKVSSSVLWIYRGTSRIRKCLLLGPFSRPVPRALRWSWGGGRLFMSEVPMKDSCTGRWPRAGLPPSQPYSSPVPRALSWSYGGAFQYQRGTTATSARISIKFNRFLKSTYLETSNF
jgi:hypothetical protein